MWAQPYGQNGSQSGSGLRPITEAQAMQYAERELTVEQYEELFGAVEDA